MTTQAETVDVAAQTGLSTILITPQGISQEYGIPVATQKDLRETGRFVPVIRVGGRLYHRRALVEQFLDAHTDPCSAQQSGDLTESQQRIGERLDREIPRTAQDTAQAGHAAAEQQAREHDGGDIP